MLDVVCVPVGLAGACFIDNRMLLFELQVSRRTALTLKSLVEDPSHIQSFVQEQLQHQLHVGSNRQVEMTGLRRAKGNNSAVESKVPVNGLRSREAAEIHDNATVHSVPSLDSRKDQ